MTYACTEERVLKDLAGHEMHIIRDDGVHRHIRFKRPGEGVYWFDLITWPGTLCIDGDCGTYVFRRLEDMFEFFRTDREYALRKGRKLGINPQYWAEKLRAHDGFQEFSEERFRENVKRAFDNWVECEAPEDGEAEPDEIAEFTALKNALWAEIEGEVLCNAGDGEIRAIDSALAFDGGNADFNFEDAWEWGCKEFTFQFLWCCYAIAWGIQLYDETKAAEQKEIAA
jgi:hypothetical protein